MKIKHNDIVIPPENPFENCKLGRKKYAEILTSIVGSYADGFVLAINNEWGTGKTTFIKMWQQHLNIKEFRTLYFNAWENDFDSNPLVPIMSELKTLIKDGDDTIFKSLLQKGAIITKKILPALLKAIAGKYIDSDIVVDAIKDSTEAATEILKDEIDEYAAKKKGLTEFRDELAKFITIEEDKRPIVFIIDELDRCRPNYAVEVLEQIKHFFSVPGIVFVLSIDKEQLGHAVRGVYGSEQLNVNEYLRRFIDLEFSIPVPDPKLYSLYLYEFFQFDDFFFSEKRRQHSVFSHDQETLIEISSLLFEKGKLTLRQQEKIFAHIRLTLNLFTSNSYVFPGVIFVLLYFKSFYREIYSDIKLKKLDAQTLLDKFSEVMPKGLPELSVRKVLFVEALLVSLYYNYIQEYSIKKLLVKNETTGLKESIVKSKIDDSTNSVFSSFLDHFQDNFSVRDATLEFLLNKIDLLESFQD